MEHITIKTVEVDIMESRMVEKTLVCNPVFAVNLKKAVSMP
jgi:hypothetical protein